MTDQRNDFMQKLSKSQLEAEKLKEEKESLLRLNSQLKGGHSVQKEYEEKLSVQKSQNRDMMEAQKEQFEKELKEMALKVLNLQKKMHFYKAENYVLLKQVDKITNGNVKI